MSQAPADPDARRFPASCDARLKLCVALVAWLLLLSADRPRAALVIGGAAWVSLLALGKPRARGLRALRAALFTGGMAIVLRLLLTGGEPALVGRALGREWALSRAGIDAASLLGARIVGAVGVAAWLGATTPFGELERALAWLRVPPPLLEIASLARRYVSVLEHTLHTARAAQTLRLGYKTTRASLASAGVLAGLLVGRAVDQSVITGQAMLLRGYRPAQARSLSPRASHGNRRLSLAALALFSIALLLGGGVNW
jgi:cobalt/nickel transport system permease protein